MISRSFPDTLPLASRCASRKRPENPGPEEVVLDAADIGAAAPLARSTGKPDGAGAICGSAATIASRSDVPRRNP